MCKRIFVQFINIIGIIAALFVIGAIFAVAVTILFDFQVVGGKIIAAFWLAILGAFTLLGAALILSIMMNLNRLADAAEGVTSDHKHSLAVPVKIGLCLAIFPIIFIALYVVDHILKTRNETAFVTAAQTILAENEHILNATVDYTFSDAYLAKTASYLKILEKVDARFSTVRIIVPEKIMAKDVFLRFHSYYSAAEPHEPPRKIDYVMTLTEQQKRYLNEVFSGQQQDYLFIANGDYNGLYYPVNNGDDRAVLYFSNLKRHGAYGY